MSISKNKIIVIVGTTGSGKTALAVDLAWKFNGEVISADSRQVYKYMDIGTGKDLDEYMIRRQTRPQREHSEAGAATGNRQQNINIVHHCIDLVHPNTEFNLGKWKKQAEKAIREISKRHRVPIVAGGTGLYAQALVDNYNLSQSKPDKKQRARLEKMSAEKLFEKLLKLNEKMALRLNVSDKKNKRRLIRCLELGDQGSGIRDQKSNYDSLVLGITWPVEVLKERMLKRINDRLEKEDMLGEVERLHSDHKVSWKRLSNFGLEYKYLSSYLRKEISYDNMVLDLARATYQFSRRQMTWLRRWERQGRKIYWVKNKTEARKAVGRFLK